VDGLAASSQNRWPSLERDVGAINDRLGAVLPAGFYYKTFMWPQAFWTRVYEPRIRAAAGLGKAPTAPDPDRYLHRYAHCDVLVVGAGPAGLMAALAAGRAGARVLLADEQMEPGGGLLAEGPGTTLDGRPPMEWVAAALAELMALAEVTLLRRATVFGYYDHNLLAILERVTDHLPAAPPDLPRQRLWQVRAKQVVLAAGAIERPLVFSDNDRPGVMLAGAARAYLKRWAVRVGERAVVFTNNDTAYVAALELRAAGVRIEAIVDVRPAPGGPLVNRAREQGIQVRVGSAVIGTAGRRRVREVRVASLETGGNAAESAVMLPCDCLLVSGGWNPTVHLFSQSRGRLRFDERIAAFVPGEAAQPVHVAGACSGSFGLRACLAEGVAAGVRAAEAAGSRVVPPDLPEVDEPASDGLQPLWRVPSGRAADRRRAFVDFQNDVTAKDLELAVAEGFRSIEHVKRYTTTGMGTDQGKTSNVNALAIVATTLGQPIEAVGTTTFRPPYTPVTFGAMAGASRGALFDPVRKAPTHAWAEAAGAVFEDVGQWKRAWYFPGTGEDMAAAVARECRAVREGVGIFDASTLGKIDLQGPDAAEFLNRVYTNAWTRLEVGRCRYGLMLRDDGMVLDDGVTARLGPGHFHMTTTTGGAARVFAWLEEWLQTEWPELRVFCTSVTDQWAAIALAGPRARDVLAAAGTDIDLSREAFPHLAVREGEVAGMRARVFRISFSGEPAFEVNVPAGLGQELWERLWAAGQPFAITPYGTETMHVLRAEKGYIIVGQETDGTTTPLDLGMDWIIAKSKPDFIGKRGLVRPDLQRRDRKQLVGLLTRDPRVVLEEGAQILGEPDYVIPARMIGHVTSSYMSANLGRSIALALVEGGRSRLGQSLWVAMPDRVIEVEVARPVFLDPENRRLDG
jgi:sarcosine oxidase subunit alpha